MEEKLIKAVRNRQILFDTNHPDYAKPKLKYEKWEEVAMEAGIGSGAEAKVIWEKLRHSLRDALRRQKGKKNGSTAESVKLWKFQKQMGFLQPYMTNKSREGNLGNESENQFQGDDATCGDDSIGWESLHEEEVAQTQTQSLNIPSTSKRVQKNTIAGLLKRSIEQHEYRRKIKTDERKILNDEQKTSDPMFHFFMCMYESTKRMPSVSQFLVRNEIFRVVTNMEASLLNISTPHLVQNSASCVRKFDPM